MDSRSLARRSLGLRLLARLTGEAGYEIVPVTEHLLQEALDLYRSRNDKEWGLTDCTSFILMRQRGVTEALTADIHFTQCRFQGAAGGRECLAAVDTVIPFLLAPFRRPSLA